MKNPTLKNIVTFAPLGTLILLFVFLLTNFIYDDECYDSLFYSLSIAMSNVFGFSLLTTLVYGYMAIRHNFCLYSKIAIAGLLFQNLTNIVAEVFDLNYDYNYQAIVLLGLSVFISFSLIFSRHVE